MRNAPVRSTCPDVGWSYPASMLSSVVLPQPEGPTIATNSPSMIRREMLWRTSTAPNDRQTPFRRKRSPVIAPPDARNARHAHHQPIDDDADRADHHHA